MLILNEILAYVVGNLVLEAVVGHDDFKQLVRQVVLGALVIVLDNGGADLGRRNRHDGANHPIRTAPEAVQTHEIHILIRNTAKEALNVFHLQVLALLCCRCCSAGTFDVVPLSHNASDALANIAVGLPCSTAVLALLATTTDGLAKIENGLPALLALSADDILVCGLVNEKFGTTYTDAIQNIQDGRKELNEIHRARKLEMAKVARARMIRLTATATRFSVI